MGSKSRAFYTTGGHCIRECANRDLRNRCRKCLNFSEWKIPEICTLSTLALLLEKNKEWLAWGRCKHVMQEKGMYTKCSSKHTLEILREPYEEV